MVVNILLTKQVGRRMGWSEGGGRMGNDKLSRTENAFNGAQSMKIRETVKS